MDITMLLPFVPVDRRHALYQGTPLPDRTHGAALFADISGFTPLTAALAAELGRQRGAEVVLDYLNPIYEALISELHTYHGSVIGFAGDSITCWIAEETADEHFNLQAASLAAVTCAFAMQNIVARMGHVVTPGGKELTLSIKIAVATGPARRFLVGHPGHQLFEALAGVTLERMAAAEHQAEKGDVMVSAEVAEILDGAITIAEWRTEAETGRSFARVSELPHPAPQHPWSQLPDGALSSEQLQPWLAAPITERLLSGATYLAELRPATSLFLKFEGIDYDDDDAAGHKLDAFIRWVQEILDHYGGTMRQLTIGDKGSNLLAVFGAPVAHDDDNARAIAAALELRTPSTELPFIASPQIGVSQGLVWAGACGGRLRCIYTVMGDEVNMAARLMGKAKPGQILVNQSVADNTARSYEVEFLGPMQLKGRAEPLNVSEITGKRQARLSALFNTPLVGREDFLSNMRTLLQTPGQILRLEGPAGVGKSHLATVFAEQVAASGWQVVLGLCQSISQGTAYTPWRQLFAMLLRTSFITPPKIQAVQVMERLMEVNAAWETRLPLLNELLDLPLPENDMTAALEPKLRQQALFALVAEILQAWAERQPLLLLLEDVHWMDEASAALTVAIARALYHSPAALLLVQRPPLEEQRILPELEPLTTHQHLLLGDLSAEGMKALVRNRLGGDVEQLALDLIFAQAQGNPFFTEELVDTLRETGYLVHREAEGKWRLSEPAFEALLDANCVIKVEGNWQMVENPPLSATALDIPDSVHGTVLARMDRLPEAHKLTLKVASVIGRTFQLAALQSVHPGALPHEVLREQIEAIGQRDFVRLETALEGNPVYIFKHNTTQEVAYDTLLYAQRQQLHGAVGAWYEHAYGAGQPLEALTLESPLAVHYPLLVHHWRNAGQPERERVYAGLAGEQAAKQFANEGALRYFSRALELTPETQPTERYKLLLGRENVNDWLSHRDQQAADLETLVTLSDTLADEAKRATVQLRYANYFRYIDAYPAALKAAQRAIASAQAAADTLTETRATHEMGRIALMQGDYTAAKTHLNQALDLARTHQNTRDEARSLYDLGSVYYQQQQYAEARQHYHEAQERYHVSSYRPGEVQCLIMFGALYYQHGEYTDAQKSYTEGLALSQAIGWRYAETYLLGSLGNSAFDLGDYSAAQSYHENAHMVAQSINYQYQEAVSLDTLSLIHQFKEDHARAHDYAERALALNHQIGDRRSEGYSYDHLGLALTGLGDYAAARTAFEEALAIRRELEQIPLTMDDLAGLARVALARGDQIRAYAHVQEILSWLAENSPDGIEFPVWVYLTCYQVLSASGTAPETQTRAREILGVGYQLLQKRAGQIQDEAIRRQFLEQVPFNRALLEAWKAHGGSGIT
ncbi:MAG: tetratricopeptide repeat protein [Anaerolineae bacterium]|nr:tetratricopeptide repeat protein [Anaerolineae bacterium]